MPAQPFGSLTTETLTGYNNFRVDVKDLTIRIDAGAARVTFRREDTIDGRILPHPDLKEVLLDKQANGRLTRRRSQRCAGTRARPTPSAA